MRLDKLTWKQAEAAVGEDATVLLPVGSIEQHGPLGPLGTDYIIPEEIARRLADQPGLLVLPALPYGVCPGHLEFPGTIDIGHDAFRAVVVNIALSLMEHGVRKFIFLNGHGGNTAPLGEAGLAVYQNGGLAAIIDWWSLAPQLNPSWLGGHGAGQETSVMMAIKPEWVDKSLYFPAEIRQLSTNLTATHLGTVRFGDGVIRIVREVRDVTTSGAFGPDDPREANAAWGTEMLAGVTDYIQRFIEEFQRIELPPRGAPGADLHGNRQGRFTPRG